MLFCHPATTKYGSGVKLTRQGGPGALARVCGLLGMDAEFKRAPSRRSVLRFGGVSGGSEVLATTGRSQVAARTASTELWEGDRGWGGTPGRVSLERRRMCPRGRRRLRGAVCVVETGEDGRGPSPARGLAAEKYY